MKANESKQLRELLRLLIRGLGILEKDEASCCGISIAQCHALVELGRTGRLSLNELAQILGLDKSTMSRTVNNLVESGLAVREAHTEDRRYVTLELSELGRKTFDDLELSMEAYYNLILEAIPEGKREQVIESLKILSDVVAMNKCC